jgi:hypothetical protein
MIRAPLLPVALAAFAAAAAVAAAAIVMARSGPAAAWVAAAGTCAAGWLAYATVAGPWSWPAVTGLVVPAVILMPLWPAVQHYEARAEEAERRRQAAASLASGLRKWADLLARIGHKGVQAVERTDTRNGYDIRLRLPAHGRVTFKSLAGTQDRLEIAAKARRGSLRFEQLPGGLAHEVMLHVSERDVLAETIPLPADNRTLTINRPIPVGLYEDGSVCSLTFREVATLIVGLRGSGKSSLINVLIAQLARCVDVLLFVIDLKGGRMATPWLRPWLEWKTMRPVIDWVATTPEEAGIMLEACLRGIEARSRAGTGGEKITPSTGHPAVLVIVDEAAVIFGQNMGGNTPGSGGPTNYQLAQLAKRLTILGRSEAIDPLFSVQRGTVTMTGDGDLKSQCDLRIGLGVATEADARLIIPDDVRVAADLARLTHPGSGIVQVRQGRVSPVKFYRITDTDIAAIAGLTGHWRPAPDPLLAQAFGPLYTTRWTERGGYLVPQSSSSGPAVTPPGADPDEFMSIVRSNLADIDKPVSVMPGDDASPPRKRMREFVQRMGRTRGVTVGAIVKLLESEKMPVTRQTVHRWLNDDMAAGLVEKDRFGSWKWKEL